MGQLIIDGNSVYEVDEECLRKKRINPECRIKEAMERQEMQRRAADTKNKNSD
ncbi:MAG: hypothetical protein MR508_06665 [Lachnospiraceae bacterium]|nr:hypothetical protein [Lachnospiraceae bacterium]